MCLTYHINARFFVLFCCGDRVSLCSLAELELHLLLLLNFRIKGMCHHMHSYKKGVLGDKLPLRLTPEILTGEADSLSKLTCNTFDPVESRL